MKINELVKQAYETAKEKGWHEKERSPLEVHALIHSEISEATEEARKNAPPVYQQAYSMGNKGSVVFVLPQNTNHLWNSENKPEGEAIELADAVIRIADYFGERCWNLEETIKLKMEYNKTRSYRHGNKKY